MKPGPTFFFRSAAVLAAYFAAAILCLTPCAAAEPANFITRRGDQLFDGDRPFRFISFNIPNLLVIEDGYEFTRPNPWRWPDEFEVTDALESVRQMGGQVVRTYVISVKREGSDMGDFVHVRGPGKFNEEGFRALDKMIEVARRKGIRVVIPLVDQHKWWGGIAEYAAFRGKSADAFWSDRQIIEDYKATVRYLINRKNVYTGATYRDEPAIFGWQTGNEINSTPEWTREISEFIKKLDANHLVLDGKSLRGVPTWSLDDPNIDVITTHHYPWGADHDYVKPIREAHALTKGKKAYFVGEFGFVETPHIANAINAVIDDGISGALLWSLRMHRREGGFYWHMEVGTGRNIYKAYHWPGFASGERYDEREILQLLREKAFAIRGLAAPPFEPPAPPKLLPIESAGAISWQGSAGASEYDVWRASDPDGRWEKLAASVSDAEVQYRPLFNDTTAIPGQSYYYRVVARNSGGESEPSNVVGPVKVQWRTLVDECRDLSATDETKGEVSIATENARTVQEDCNRLAMRPGSSIVYRVDAPISRWRVFSFARDSHVQLEFAVSSDGKKFPHVPVGRRAFASGPTAYGYLTPVLYEGDSGVNEARFLRISMPDSQSVKRNGESNGAPLEIGRVEIEFDRITDSDARPASDAAAKPAPANPAVFVYGPRSVDRTLESIDLAAKRGDGRLNVVVTILVDLTDDFRIKSFGRFARPWSDYQPYDDKMRRELRNSLQEVFGRMVKHDMDIFILPHIDAGGDVETWRNWVDFDPLEPYAGYTYNDLVLDTIAEALRASVDDDTRVKLCLSGEMGTSLFLYPESYRKMIARLREESELKHLKIGFSLNHDKIAGEENPNGTADIQLTEGGRHSMQALINECDFVGMSFYRPVNPSPTPDDFVQGIEAFIGQFKKHGLTIPLTKELQFSEVGIGGGNDGESTSDPAKAVTTPWEGTSNPRENPWEHEAMRDLRRQYHRALLDFLTQQPAPWRVSAAFFWSMGSWDPQGTLNPVFADSELIDAIERHNVATATSR